MYDRIKTHYCILNVQGEEFLNVIYVVQSSLFDNVSAAIGPSSVVSTK